MSKNDDEKKGIPKNIKVAAWAGLAGVSVMLAAPIIALLWFGGIGGGAILAMLAWLGSLVGGGAVMGLAVLMASGAAGGGVAAAITAAIADKVITDPDLIRLSKMVAELNELLDKAAKATDNDRKQIRELNDRYGRLLKEKKDDSKIAALEKEVNTLLRLLKGK